MAKWTAFPYASAEYTYDAAALKKQWARLHAGDAEPLPKDDKVLAAWALLLALSLAVGVFFTLQGAWYVLLFSALEIGVVTAAFIVYSRHATDCDRIVLENGLLFVEQLRGGKIRLVQLDPHWLRVVAPRRKRDPIRLEARGISVDVGVWLPDEGRRALARELARERELLRDVSGERSFRSFLSKLIDENIRPLPALTRRPASKVRGQTDRFPLLSLNDWHFEEIVRPEAVLVARNEDAAVLNLASFRPDLARVAAG